MEIWYYSEVHQQPMKSVFLDNLNQAQELDPAYLAQCIYFVVGDDDA